MNKQQLTVSNNLKASIQLSPLKTKTQNHELHSTFAESASAGHVHATIAVV
jgi:hypothetical protein